MRSRLWCRIFYLGTAFVGYIYLLICWQMLCPPIADPKGRWIRIAFQIMFVAFLVFRDWAFGDICEPSAGDELPNGTHDRASEYQAQSRRAHSIPTCFSVVWSFLYDVY